MSIRPRPGPRRVRLFSTALGPIALATAIAGIASLGTASAAGLFEPVSTADVAESAVAVSRHAKRARIVRVDPDYLEKVIAPRGLDRRAHAPESGPARIDLFPDVSLTLDRERLGKAFGGGYVWSGDVRGGGAGVADLVVSGDRVTGQIQTRSAVYRISPLEDGLHKIEEVDGASFPKDIAVPSPSLPGAAVTATPAAPQAKSVIRVIMPYTGSALQRVGAIDDAAQLAISLANRALRFSNVNAKFKLVGTMLMKKHYDPKMKYVKTLKKATKGKKAYRAIHKLRDRKSADLVAVLRTGDELCGIAWYNVDTSPADAPYGFSVNNVDCITIQVVSHEMGHNAGLTHDRYVLSSNPSKREYNFGYVNLDAEVISVMAYDYKCYVYGKECIHAAMYSTPRETYLGAKMGVPKGQSGAADAARALKQTLPSVAAFR
jgi:hypothetical protein